MGYPEQNSGMAVETIQTAIENAYMGSISAMSSLQTRIQTKKGNLNTYFVDFYQKFSELYLLTRVYVKTVNSDELHANIERFFEASPVTEERAMHGMRLFRDYQTVLIAERVIVNKGMV